MQKEMVLMSTNQRNLKLGSPLYVKRNPENEIFSLEVNTIRRLFPVDVTVGGFLFPQYPSTGPN